MQMSMPGAPGAPPDNPSAQCLEELTVLLDDMRKADRLFQPTQFWLNCSAAIVDDLRSRGFEDFKSHRSALAYFVPSYAKARERYSRTLAALLDRHLLPETKILRRLQDYLNGRQQALADYRVARAATPEPGAFLGSGESRIGNGLLHEIGGASFGKACLNYLRGLAFLQRVPGYRSDPARTFLEIGGGFGSLGEIVLTEAPENRYMNVDIPPVLPVSTYYLKSLFGRDAVQSYALTRGLNEIGIAACFARYRAATLPTWQLPLLRGAADCFVNFVSFQEMEPAVVRNYIGLVMPLTRKYVILRNSRHGKRLAKSDGNIGVEQPTTLDMMIEWFSDFEVFDRDSLVFGDESRFGSFRSEVAVLKRKTAI